MIAKYFFFSVVDGVLRDRAIFIGSMRLSLFSSLQAWSDSILFSQSPAMGRTFCSITLKPRRTFTEKCSCSYIFTEIAVTETCAVAHTEEYLKSENIFF